MHKCHVNHQGTHQTLYILNQNHPGYLSIFSALTNLTIDFDAESAVFTLSCSHVFLSNLINLYFPGQEKRG